MSQALPMRKTSVPCFRAAVRFVLYCLEVDLSVARPRPRHFGFWTLFQFWCLDSSMQRHKVWKLFSGVFVTVGAFFILDDGERPLLREPPFQQCTVVAVFCVTRDAAGAALLGPLLRFVAPL